MICIVYERKAHRLTADGHAGSGPEGHDLVCAGVSALLCTLASAVRGLAESFDDEAEAPEITLTSGYAVIACRPSESCSALTTLIFDCFCGGFALLAKRHPENISYLQEEG